MKQFIYPYIMLKNTREASEYYKEIFNGEITYIMLGKDMPDCPEDQLDNIMHLQLKFNENTIYMADEDIPSSGNIHIHLDYENEVEMKVVYEKMKKDSTVLQEMHETFWGAVYGALKDKYDIIWQFHYSLPEPKK